MSQSDREMLELAAKAAGLPVTFQNEFGDSTEVNGWWPCGYDESGDVESWWNPLTDDGDALRLAVKLHIQITPRSDGKSEAAHTYFYIEEGDDRCAATRRAITRAAAEIGRAMP